jgi:serine protease Do
MQVRILSSSLMSLLLLLPCLTVMAQDPPRPPKADSAAKAEPSEKAPKAPQVVTVIHRMNGLQMFRLLLRSEQQVEAIAGFDSSFNLLDDVHTNVIAGLAMDDGETIAAWLPEADVEFSAWSFPFPEERVVSPRPPGSPRGRVNVEVERTFRSGRPDLSVIGADGKPLAAEYVGLDGITGLTILRLSNKDRIAPRSLLGEQVRVGQTVRLFGPEPVKNSRTLNRGLFVRVGAIPGRVLTVMRAPTGGIARFKIRSPGLSKANIGGVAVNQQGNTIGIVDGINGADASILPTELIKLAANRVLEQKMSVPKPWLGVRGEAVEALSMDRLLTHGWEPQRAKTIAEGHKGIFLTSVAPGSPAAEAALRAGDVILKINDREIASADDFTWSLEQIGADRSLSFTLARPDRLSMELINIELSLKEPDLSYFPRVGGLPTRAFSLEQGIETIELRPAVAAKLGASNAGLLVVFVQPSTPAFAAGLQPGDFIELIDGKPIAPPNPTSFVPPRPGGTYTLHLVRKMQKIVVTLKTPEKKN